MVGPTQTCTSEREAKGVPILAGAGGSDIVAVSRFNKGRGMAS